MSDDVAVERFRKFLTIVGGPPGVGKFPKELLGEPVDDEPNAPTWAEWIGVTDDE